jgi:thioredoxin reductase
LDVDTTIVGAGPYGLSIAAHLRSARVPFEQFGTPLDSWRTFMPRGMVLKSERFASNLWDPERRYSLKRFCEQNELPYQPVGSPLSLEHFLRYADWFRAQAVGEPRDLRIIDLRRAARGFTLKLSDGTEFSSRRVVLATGHLAYQTVPVELAGAAEPLVLHSARIGDVARYANRDVCIIGAGQSALETAAILHENGARVRMLVRRDRLEWNAPSKPRSALARLLEPDAGVATGWKSWAISEMPRTFRWYFPPERRHWFVARSYGPSGSWWLRRRVEGNVEVSLGTKVHSVGAQNGRAQLQVEGPAGRGEVTADHVIAATGYKVDIARLAYLEASLLDSIEREAGGIPRLDSSFETSVPGLFMVGITSAPVFGPIMRFMYGAKHAAPVVARRLKAA